MDVTYKRMQTVQEVSSVARRIIDLRNDGSLITYCHPHGDLFEDLRVNTQAHEQH